MQSHVRFPAPDRRSRRQSDERALRSARLPAMQVEVKEQGRPRPSGWTMGAQGTPRTALLPSGEASISSPARTRVPLMSHPLAEQADCSGRPISGCEHVTMAQQDAESPPARLGDPF